MIEQAQEIEQEIEAPLDNTEVPVSLRDTIKQARDNALEDTSKEEPVAKKVKIEKAERARSEDGKFAQKEAKEAKTQIDKIPHEAEAKPVKEVQQPRRYGAAVRNKWNELPEDIRQELLKSEDDFHKELTKHDEERLFGRTIEKVVMPYAAQIRAEGATIPQALESLLNTAHVLRVGTPQQKSQLLLQTAQTFGVDLRQALQQGQQPINPMLQGLQQQVQSLQQRLEQEAALKKQQEDQSIQQQIGAFSADPANVHFETVKAHMASLLSSGLAKDLKDAYDQAVYANPQTRSTLLEQQKSASNESRVAEQKARAEAAKKAGSSIKGAPGIAASKNGKIVQPDLNKAIRAAFAEHRGEA